MNNELVHIANTAFDLHASEIDLIDLLAQKINYLIVNDFNKLIAILYRADISEKKLNTLLEQKSDEPAGKLIAVLFIERQLQKIKSRQESRRDVNDIAEEDRW
jgi:hypothetical protein